MVAGLQYEDRAMKCLHCQGQMERATAPLHIDRHGVHLSVDSVPAWVCKQCGEVLFDEAGVDSIQAILRTVDEQTARLTSAN